MKVQLDADSRYHVLDHNGHIFAVCSASHQPVMIVSAMNSHDSLVTVSKKILANLGTHCNLGETNFLTPDVLAELKAALALAEGE